MQDLINTLGVDWKLLVSQAVNFALVLIVLRLFVYKPVLKILKDRRQKIEEGLAKATEADKRMREIAELKKEKMREAEQEALAMLRTTEERAKTMETELLEQARAKEAALLASAERAAEGKKSEAMKEAEQEAVKLVRAALVKTVEMAPHDIDEALVHKALKALK